MMRADFFGLQSAPIIETTREAYNGILVGNMGYTPEEAAQSIKSGITQAVAFGHHYVSNPNLVEKIRNGQALV